ncbi:uncharacterized protein N7469_007659 [Penicillium citrinum]|uniref:Uncharacterized protein n=1 Tax=Penicillium citrinum TaxID=5077 RepID=A0A9W9NWZ9_PENCI|nr:uncharacterized protein N7469_007659 [Penicillium citrinum]KAJ5227653.1 hypothetical protein N7469_007659 [Penicillium citrinum]
MANITNTTTPSLHGAPDPEKPTSCVTNLQNTKTLDLTTGIFFIWMAVQVIIEVLPAWNDYLIRWLKSSRTFVSPLWPPSGGMGINHSRGTSWSRSRAQRLHTRRRVHHNWAAKTLAALDTTAEQTQRDTKTCNVAIERLVELTRMPRDSGTGSAVDQLTGITGLDHAPLARSIVTGFKEN